ncbi:MAG TPA: GNAT family protein [Gaiellaceae bacterium]|nr:GNAT family protein [Gaiellaceae bacterium]
MNALIRAAVPGDAESLVSLAIAVAGEKEGWLIADARWRTVGEERRYIRTLQRHPDATLLVADVEGELVGRLSLMRDPHPASSHVADLGVMVAAGHRRSGIGTALMEAAEAWAARAGVTKLELHVFPHNRPAITLYEKLGYEREGLRRQHYARSDGGFSDVLLMAKQL